jgi:molybdopterin-guanine dinucleotide biosynthesis protein A
MEQAGYEPCFVARDRRLAEFGPVLVEDLSGEVHPLNGVVAALQQGGGVMAPCDLPFLPAEAFSGLNWGELEAGCPLLGKLGPAWLPRATMFLAQQRSVRAFAQAAHRVTMPSDWLRNVNRPSDLDRPSS